jgi:ribosomal protein L31
MNCNNCGSNITCGCQKRTASNGVEVCSSCITAYEDRLRQQIQELDNSNYNIKPN